MNLLRLQSTQMSEFKVFAPCKTLGTNHQGHIPLGPTIRPMLQTRIACMTQPLQQRVHMPACIQFRFHYATAKHPVSMSRHIMQLLYTGIDVPTCHATAAHRTQCSYMSFNGCTPASPDGPSPRTSPSRRPPASSSAPILQPLNTRFRCPDISYNARTPESMSLHVMQRLHTGINVPTCHATAAHRNQCPYMSC